MWRDTERSRRRGGALGRRAAAKRNLLIAPIGDERHAEIAELFQAMAQLSKHKRIAR